MIISDRILDLDPKAQCQKHFKNIPNQYNYIVQYTLPFKKIEQHIMLALVPFKNSMTKRRAASS